jgi:hypothetical protein
MSMRDRGLLEAAGLSMADATSLFQRSRQAIYQGLSHRRDYFSAQEAMVVLHDARRKDSLRLEALMKFIEKNYPQADSELILPNQVAFEQITHVVEGARGIILVFNGNIDHLAPGASLSRVLKHILDFHRHIVSMIVPGTWVIGYLEQALKFKGHNRVIISEEAAYMPSFILVAKDKGYRSFFFGRFSLEEVLPTEAERLWKHFESKCLENVEHKSREVG